MRPYCQALSSQRELCLSHVGLREKEYFAQDFHMTPEPVWVLVWLCEKHRYITKKENPLAEDGVVRVRAAGRKKARRVRRKAR